MKILPNLFRWPGLICYALTLILFADSAHSAKVAPPTAQTAPEVQSLSGLGENFEVILKYSPFTSGNDVSLTAYVLDKTTNEPIKGAILSGSMSSGSASLNCTFTETSRLIAGAYQGTIRVVSDEPYSWLFDISLGDKNDLIAIDGFKPGGVSKGISAPVASEPKATSQGINLTVVEIITFISAFMVFQLLIFFFMRKRFLKTPATKDPR